MSNKQTILDFLSATTEQQAAHSLYKHTDCGAWIEFLPEGVRIGSIVEGADFGTATYMLRYSDGFTSSDIQDCINAIEAEASAVWEWANEVHEGDDDTWANLGLDAPDVAFEYRHLCQEG